MNNNLVFLPTIDDLIQEINPDDTHIEYDISTHVNTTRHFWNKRLTAFKLKPTEWPTDFPVTHKPITHLNQMIKAMCSYYGVSDLTDTSQCFNVNTCQSNLNFSVEWQAVSINNGHDKFVAICCCSLDAKHSTNWALFSTNMNNANEINMSLDGERIND